MAVSPERLEEVSELVDKANAGRVPDYLGTVDKGITLVRRSLTYQRRAVYAGQILLPDFDTQPVIGLEIEGKGVHALPYGRDVEQLEEGLRERVVSVLKGLAGRGRI